MARSRRLIGTSGACAGGQSLTANAKENENRMNHTKICPRCEGEGHKGNEELCVPCGGRGYVPTAEFGKAVAADVFNPAESDLDYFKRRLVVHERNVRN